MRRLPCELCRPPDGPARAGAAGLAAGCRRCAGAIAWPRVAAPRAFDSDAPLPRLVRFTFTCQRCGSALEGSSDVSGRLGRCPTCGAVFVVPQIDRRTGLPMGPAVVADDGELPTPMHAYAAAGEKAPQIRRRPDGSQAIVCPRCSQESPMDADLCSRCGLPFTIEGASHVSAATAGQGDGLAVAAMLVGILSLPAFCLVVGGPTAVLLGAWCLARTSVAQGGGRNRGLAVTGVVCGAISTAMSAAFYLTR